MLCSAVNESLRLDHQLPMFCKQHIGHSCDKACETFQKCCAVRQFGNSTKQPKCLLPKCLGCKVYIQRNSMYIVCVFSGVGVEQSRNSQTLPSVGYYKQQQQPRPFAASGDIHADRLIYFIAATLVSRTCQW